MPEPLLVTQLIRRVEQGITRPFLCKASDSHHYYVKSPKAAGHDAVCKEWLAARIASEWGLPLPACVILTVPMELFEGLLSSEHRELGHGDVFGSREIPQHQDITVLNEATHLDPKQAAEILLFDWWLLNSDRSMTESGGNSNLIWSSTEKKLYIIDHNNAFDQELLADSFWNTHIFRNYRSQWDNSFQRLMTPKMERIVKHMDEYWQELPERWLFLDSDLMTPTRFQFDAVMSVLERFFTAPEAFWGGRR